MKAMIMIILMTLSLSLQANGLYRIVGVKVRPSDNAPPSWQLLAAYDAVKQSIVPLEQTSLPDAEHCDWKVASGSASMAMTCSDAEQTELLISLDRAKWTNRLGNVDYVVSILPYRLAQSPDRLTKPQIRATFKPSSNWTQAAKEAMARVKKAGDQQPIQFGVFPKGPKATSSATVSVNLDARVAPPINPFVGPSPTPNDDVDPNSYNSRSSFTIYDSLGDSHVLTQYFVKMEPFYGYGINQWRVYSFIDGYQLNDPASAPLINEPMTPLSGSSLLQFDPSGNFKGAITDSADPGSIAPNGNKIDYDPATTWIAPSAFQLDISLDLTGTTQVGSAFSVNGLHINGRAPLRYPPGFAAVSATSTR